MIDFEQIEIELKNKLNASNVWIPIYQNNFKDKISRHSWFMTFSTDKQRTMKTENWDFHFGTYYCRSKGDFGDIKYYLVIERAGNRHLDGHIEIAEDFRLFYNLYEDNKDYYIDEDDNPQKVIRYNQEKELYEIRFSYLKEYISYKKIYAVLNFELDYYCKEYLPDKEISENNILASRRSWNGPDNDFTTRFMGKVILDYSEIKSKEEEVKFVIGKDNNDEYLYAIIKDGYADKIVDVCFDRKVLKKYYDKPEIYHVAYSNVFCGSKWSLDGLNRESFREIIVSTHNLSQLPYNEQVHWREFSKLSEDLTMNTKDIHITSDLITHINNFKFSWNKKYDKVLLREVAAENKYIANKIYVPITNELSEFFEVIKSIYTLCIETIDTRVLRENTRDEFISKDYNGTIINSTRCALKDFIVSCNIEFEKEDEFLKYLIAIRDHCSHIKNRDYKKAQEYFNIEEIGTQQCIINIAHQLCIIYKKLACCFDIYI